MAVIVPPIKCQGIKTKLIPAIRSLTKQTIQGRWIEPFFGSGVVALNILPERAFLTDTNKHIIAVYCGIQTGVISPGSVEAHLRCEGKILSETGENHFYAVRERFNETHDPLDFLFLNRACFNGVMRFNQKGKFNTPFCRKPERFAPAYITKIVNQVRAVRDVVNGRDWTFAVADFRETLAQATVHDFVYADPPYAGRHTDYFNGWSDADEEALCGILKSLSCPFLLSTWQENTYRRNASIDLHWQGETIRCHTVEHFYHVGSSEDLRHPMTEALITNFGSEPGTELKPSLPKHMTIPLLL